MDYQDLVAPDRGRVDADRGAPGPRDGPPGGLRRRGHPGRPRLRGPRSWTWAARPGWSPRSKCTRCGSATGAAPSPAVRGPPSGVTPTTYWHWCDGGPTDLSNLALLCPEAPHDRAPKGPHRDRHRDRGHVARVAAPPRDPPQPAGRTGTHPPRHGAARSPRRPCPPVLSRWCASQPKGRIEANKGVRQPTGRGAGSRCDSQLRARGSSSFQVPKLWPPWSRIRESTRSGSPAPSERGRGTDGCRRTRWTRPRPWPW